MDAVRSVADFKAVLFDLDGVLTPTANIHAACWKRVFDDFLAHHAQVTDTAFDPFDLQRDYSLYVDGKPRYPGVESFLASREIQLPYGEPSSPPNCSTVCGIGNGKDSYFAEVLHTEGIEPYPGALALVHYLRSEGTKLAVVSSSRNCKEVLKVAKIIDLFDTIMDGKLAEQLKIPGKPAPDTFLKAALQLGAEPQQAVVFEDAIAGVQAGRNGKFGWVVGVDRNDNAIALQKNGADVVVRDLRALLPE
ncbi:MAG: beta-phosphoglucomutase family hydrolase [Cyanobacteria bacterium J06597_16]